MYLCTVEARSWNFGDDMTERSLVLGGSTSKPRNIDLYVCWLPCPSFSALVETVEALIQEE